MVSYDEGCVVVHLPTEGLLRVRRWLSDESTLLLEPFFGPGDAERGTRWAFEKDVVLIKATKDSAPSPPRTTRGAPGARKTLARAKRHARANGSQGATQRGAAEKHKGEKEKKEEEADPRDGLYRRVGKIHSRLIIRTNPSRPEMGRGVFAVAPLPKGTEVMRVRAVAAVVEASRRNRTCCRCFRGMSSRARLESCPECGFGLCAECLESRPAWDAAHADTCRFTRCMDKTPLPGFDSDMLRSVADLLSRRKRGLVSDDEWEVLETLEARPVANSFREISPRVLKIARSRLRSTIGYDVSDADLRAAYHRMQRNSHVFEVLTTQSQGGLARGMFPCLALVNHACQPNSCLHAVSKVSGAAQEVEFVLRTTRDVKAGEEVCCTYHYLGIRLGLQERREFLGQLWGFRCECQACRDEASHPYMSNPSEPDIRAFQLRSELCKITFHGKTGKIPLSRFNLKMYLHEATKLLSPDSGASFYARRSLALELHTMMFAFAKDGTSQIGKTHLPGVLDPVDFGTAIVKLQTIMVDLIVGAGCIDLHAVRLLQHRYLWAKGCAKLTTSRGEAETFLRLAHRSIMDATEMAATCCGDDHEMTRELRRATEAFQRRPPLA